MLEVTGGRWPRNVPIPWATDEDMFTSRLARELKVFPYGCNIAAVVSTVMDKDRQDTTRKRRAFTRVGDPSREAKKARGLTKSAAPGSSKPPPVAKPVALGPSKPLPGAQLASPGSGKPTPIEAAEERRPSTPPRTAEVDVSMDVCVEDYLVGGVMMFDTRIGRGLVGEFFRVQVTNKVMMQGLMLGSWLSSRCQWRPHRSWRLARQRGLRRTPGLGFVPAARLL
jgi:hypothetical protein